MEIVHAARMDWGESLVPHRHGRMAHKLLFTGEENSPDNFALVLANESAEYYSPGHRHNWDQVRFCLEGSVPIGRSLRVDTGEVAYFPEGVAYGPQKGGPDRLVLVLQFGGASGQGYMSIEQAARGRKELLRAGTFDKGVFRPEAGSGRRSQDAYEAIWQTVFGRPIEYPVPRYKTPIVMRPEGFAWRAMLHSPGVQHKVLGNFPERGLELQMIAIESDRRLDVEASDHQLRLLFICEGEGVYGGERFEPQSAIRLAPGEHGALEALSATLLLSISMVLLVGDPASSRGTRGR